MSNLITVKNNVPMVSSQEVAAKFGKVHRNLMRDIQNLDCSDEFKVLNFEQCCFTNKMNRTFDGFNMTKDGFAFLCMGFTGKKAAEWKEKYITAFNSMDQSLHNVDYRMSQLAKDSEQIKDAGKAWSKMGHEVNKAKKKNKILCDDLISEVQFTLGFEG